MPTDGPSPPARRSGGAASVGNGSPPDLRVSLAALVLANLWPLAGVLFFGWTVFAVLLLFWMENVIVGVLNLSKMWMAADTGDEGHPKFFLMPFFMVHYGLFTAVHGGFIVLLFGPGVPPGLETDIDTFWRAVGQANIGLATIALAASHAISFGVNYIGKGEFRTIPLSKLMSQPYGRVVVLHLVILFGGFLVQSLGSPTLALALLVVLKIGIDMTAHRLEHTGAGGLLVLASRSRP